jgi:hypothetical protein
VGWGFPYGTISNEGDGQLNDLVHYKVPFWLEAGYRFNRFVRGNTFLELAPVSINSSVCPTGGCTGSSVRFGFDLQLHFSPYYRVDPWVGFGFGWEWLSAQAQAFAPGGAPLGKGSFHYFGFEVPLLEGGIDIPVTHVFAVGPYISWSLGEFSSVDTSTVLGHTSNSINARATHSWLQIGVKGTFNL